MGAMTSSSDAQPLPIRDESIRLGQALKLASLVEDGAMARDVVQDGMVSVNGEVETRRGRQLHDGDVVEFNGEEIVVEAGQS
ncbi:RNA-binding S4 domain-containing protein [Micrococcus porci]|uniref:RNA-binding S4 domain-containing protein n=1 Tax=Micrococcus porci TaxID=2856555 RepID=UPI003CEB111C